MKTEFIKGINLKRKEVKLMKKLILFVLLSLILGLGIGRESAQAFWVGSVWNNQLGAFVGGIQGFDWSSSGSGDAIGVGPFGNATALAVGSTFTFDYQTKLIGVTDPVGNPVAFPGLDTPTFEYTLVTSFPETVVALVPLGGGLFTALFSTLPGGVFYMYNDATPNANVPTGFGFDDGTLVASGTIDPGAFTSFTTTSSTTGIGSSIITGLVGYANPLFLDVASIIIDLRWEGTINYPPLDSATSNFFTGRAGEGNLAAYAVDTVGPGLPGDPVDLVLKVDGSSKFSTAVIPEPSTYLLMGIGLIGLAGYARRRAK